MRLMLSQSLVLSSRFTAIRKMESMEYGLTLALPLFSWILSSSMAQSSRSMRNYFSPTIRMANARVILDTNFISIGKPTHIHGSYALLTLFNTARGLTDKTVISRKLQTPYPNYMQSGQKATKCITST